MYLYEKKITKKRDKTDWSEFLIGVSIFFVIKLLFLIVLKHLNVLLQIIYGVLRVYEVFSQQYDFVLLEFIQLNSWLVFFSLFS